MKEFLRTFFFSHAGSVIVRRFSFSHIVVTRAHFYSRLWILVSLLGVYLGISNMHVTGNTQLGELPLTMVTNFFVFLTCA